MVNKTKKVVKKTTKKEEKDIPFKNYVKLFVVCIVTLAAVLGASIIYRTIEDRKLNEAVIKGHVSEIAIENFDNYVVENDMFFLYIGGIKDSNSREVETDLIEYFKKNDIAKNMVYLNASNIENLEEFFNDFNSKYATVESNKIKEYPAFVIMKNGKAIATEQKKNDEKLTIGLIDTLLESYEGAY